MSDATPSHPESREPEELLVEVNKSIFGRALLISTAAHVLFAGLTSFSLYASWAEHGVFREGYGLLSPSEIREIEQEAAKAERKREQEEQMQRELEERRKEAELAVEDEGEDAEEGDADPTAEPETTPEAPEIEPLPPKREFSLDDMPEL